MSFQNEVTQAESKESPKDIANIIRIRASYCGNCQ